MSSPFAWRIADLFGNEEGKFSFAEFLNMYSTFHTSAPTEVKMAWAFAVWDFDGKLPPQQGNVSAIRCHNAVSQFRNLQKLASQTAAIPCLINFLLKYGLFYLLV